MHKLQSAIATSVILFVLLVLGACSQGDGPPATEPSSDGPAARPDSADVAGQPLAVVAESLPYAEVNDELTYGYFAFPADMVDPLPAILVVHDRWGLNDDVRANVERLAAGGYIVLGVDLFDGQSTDSPATARGLEIAVIENRELAQDNIRQAVGFVRTSSAPPSVSILGFGFGGGWALDTAMDHPDEIAAAVSYYGQVPTDDEEIQRLEVPYLGFFSESDRAVPVASAREFSRKAIALSKDVEIRTFEDAKRGFAEVSADTFDAGATKAAWTQMLEFLDARLGATAMSAAR